MKVKVIPMKGSDLKPGDLFSTAGPEYWNHIDLQESIGERAYIRTNTSFMKAPDFNSQVYKLETELDPPTADEIWEEWIKEEKAHD
jgi:hypothetical protein